MSYASLRNQYPWLIVGTLIVGLGLGLGDLASADDDVNAIQQAKSLSRAFRSAAKQVLPTVVQVRTSSKPRPMDDRSGLQNPFKGTPFEDFFGDELPGTPGRGFPEIRPRGLGSGVIIDPSGIILTNNHVIEGADEVTVQLNDGRQFKANEIKVDKNTDLAVLQIKADESLPAARLGDSDKLEIGDWVIAIGNPFELESTVSAGIISGKGRSLGAVRRARFLQTDAAINPGNSGGPLVNLDGEVIGINTAIFSRSGGNQGIGFAIPANVARWVVPQLIKRGRVARAYLGVAIETITAERARELGVRPNEGVLVKEVFENSPAEDAGFRTDDVILSFDGHPVQSASDLQEVVERSAFDSSHEVKILRNGRPITVQVVAKAMPEQFGVASGLHQSRELGLTVVDLSGAMAEQLGYEPGSGLLIVHADRGQIAYEAGLRAGMLIRRVGKNEVKSVAEFQAALEKESLAKGITVEVQTRDGTRIVRLQSS